MQRTTRKKPHNNKIRRRLLPSNKNKRSKKKMSKNYRLKPEPMLMLTTHKVENSKVSLLVKKNIKVVVAVEEAVVGIEETEVNIEAEVDIKEVTETTNNKKEKISAVVLMMMVKKVNK